MGSPTAEKSGIRTGGATAVVLGNIIGSSIFISLHFQANALHNAWSILTVWLTGAFLAWCGAVCYAELATRFPENGGEALYLEKIYHPAAGFLSGWISLLAGFPAAIAMVALIFASYLSRDTLNAQLLAAGLIVAVTIAHCFTLKLADRVHRVVTYGKLGLLVALTVALWIATPDPQVEVFQITSRTWDSVGTSDFFVQVFFVLYAYAGWNAACYITREVHEPHKTVPRALFWGLGIATLLYLAFNATLLRAVPFSQLQSDSDIVQSATTLCFGPVGAKLSRFLICLSMVSSVSAMLWVGSRVAQKTAKHNLVLIPLAFENKAGIPVRAVVFQGIVAISILFLFSKPDAMMLYVQFLLQVAAFLTILGLFIVRRRSKEFPPNSYKAFGYPVVPAIFLVWTVVATNHLLNQEPAIVGKGLITLAVGICVWFAGKSPVKSTIQR